MKRCSTKSGELKLYHEGVDYVLDGNGVDLPDDLAESIRSHVNVVVEDSAPSASSWKRSHKPKEDEPDE